MPILIIREAARQDLEDIYDRIAGICADFELLATHSKAGPSCEFPEADLVDLRFSPVKKYRSYLVIYRPLPDGAEIVRVVHAATDMRRAFRNS